MKVYMNSRSKFLLIKNDSGHTTYTWTDIDHATVENRDLKSIPDLYKKAGAILMLPVAVTRLVTILENAPAEQAIKNDEITLPSLRTPYKHHRTNSLPSELLWDTLIDVITASESFEGIMPCDIVWDPEKCDECDRVISYRIAKSNDKKKSPIKSSIKNRHKNAEDFIPFDGNTLKTQAI